MKSITYKVIKDGYEDMNTVLVPANHTEASRPGTWGLVIAGALLLLTVTFVCLVLLAV
ncbi:MAG: hypothetical protein JWR26_4625 [Pedosphaera sp.]|nr:hypothetical protein [Pedosphaera sp.]